MGMVSLVTDREMIARNAQAKQNIDGMFDEMEQYTRRLLLALRMTAAKRRLADKVIRSVSRRRVWYGAKKHSAIQMRFLRMMIQVGIGAHPNDTELASQIGRYYSDNYIYEWTKSPITQPLRALARDMILRGADSEFGDTPQSPHLAYVLAHHEALGIENVSSYSELSTRNIGLERENYFVDRHREMHEALDLDTHIQKATLLLAENTA